MDTLLWLLLFPIAWPFIAARLFGNRISLQEIICSITLVVLTVCFVFFAGRYVNLRDTEVWNGEVISKHRDHGSYIRSYSCNCYETCSGSGEYRTCTTHCQTCYEDRYTVDWYAKTTLGKINFQSYDRTSKRVYKEPDPQSYIDCEPGQPASAERSYTNYVKGAASSLFHTDLLDERVPAYPRVYYFYRFNRVLTAGEVSIDTQSLNEQLNLGLRSLGYQKQVNIIVLLTSYDPKFKQSVENAWLGGKKNDVIVLLGTDGNKLVWHDVITWARSTGNELFAVTLRDELSKIKTYDDKKISKTILHRIEESYTRPRMEEFEYLKDAIEPSSTVIWLAVFFSLIGSIALSVFFYYYDPFDN